MLYQIESGLAYESFVVNKSRWKWPEQFWASSLRRPDHFCFTFYTLQSPELACNTSGHPARAIKERGQMKRPGSWSLRVPEHSCSSQGTRHRSSFILRIPAPAAIWLQRPQEKPGEEPSNPQNCERYLKGCFKQLIKRLLRAGLLCSNRETKQLPKCEQCWKP